jgi:DNA-binding NtrC family response regulator
MSDKNLSILIVDDEPELLELLEWDFESNNFTVFSADGPDSALKILNEEKSIQYVLSDFKMNTGTGIDLLDMVFEKEIPLKGFYIMSGYTDIETQELRDKGLTKVFNKPLSSASIIEHINSSNL